MCGNTLGCKTWLYTYNISLRDSSHADVYVIVFNLFKLMCISCKDSKIRDTHFHFHAQGGTSVTTQSKMQAYGSQHLG